ncbi:MAG: hypothetical protein A2Y77_07380 [Planctomycetes bacterium RBG_13_62_9]|nr:MAG: hypothetical protein A2Y77_07380 [Planctomycetes bacterium RBG_13_62_9]
MTSYSRVDKRGEVKGRKPGRIVGAAVLVVAIGLVAVWFTVVRGGQTATGSAAVFVAKRGPLVVSVLEAGVLKAKNPAIIRSSLPRRATIISIVPEGTRVAEGDLLVELDASELIDHLVDHEIMTNNAEAAWINAREALLITKSQAQSSVDLAELRYQFAALDLEKYTGAGGQYETDLAAAEGKIKLAEEEMKKAGDYLAWSQRLFDQRYLSNTQLQTDKLALHKAKLTHALATNDLYLLKEYTHRQRLAQLTSDVDQAARALGRAKARARANTAQMEAYLLAREQAYRNELARLARLENEIANSKLYAPTDGMVVYATSIGGDPFHDDRQPLADGVEVWERQELIHLSRSASTIAEVDVHEVSLQKVRVGLPVIVAVDALPGREIMGTVTRIAPLANSQRMWMNPQLKVYKTEIALDTDDPALRSGMNCKAQIIVEQYGDTVCVPVQAVLRVGGQPTVYVLRNGNIEERKVEIGLDDNSMVRIARGVSEGEAVLLTPPAQAGVLEPGSKLAAIRGAERNL